MKLLALTSCLLPLLRIYAILPISSELPFRLVGGMVVGEEWSEDPSLEKTRGWAEPWTRDVFWLQLLDQHTMRLTLRNMKDLVGHKERKRRGKVTQHRMKVSKRVKEMDQVDFMEHMRKVGRGKKTRVTRDEEWRPMEQMIRMSKRECKPREESCPGRFRLIFRDGAGWTHVVIRVSKRNSSHKEPETQKVKTFPSANFHKQKTFQSECVICVRDICAKKCFATYRSKYKYCTD